MNFFLISLLQNLEDKRKFYLNLQRQNIRFDYQVSFRVGARLDRHYSIVKQRVTRVALLSFCIAADKGKEKIGVLPKKRFVRPYGLPVRSLRTTSPKPTDWEFVLIGLNESIKCSNCYN